MRALNIVYECDSHRSISSMVIKGIFENKKTAINLFHKGKELYEDQEWFLNVAEYSGTINYEMDNNVLQDMETPFLTTERNE